MPIKSAKEVREEALEEHRIVLEAADRFAAWARANIGATRVLLFGSRARNDWHRDSDCDLLIISEEFAGIVPFRRPLYKDLDLAWDGPVAMNPVCHTAEEFERSRAGGYIAAMALADGARDL